MPQTGSIQLNPKELLISDMNPFFQKMEFPSGNNKKSSFPGSFLPIKGALNSGMAYVHLFCMKTVHRIGLIFLFLYPAGFSAQQGGDTSYEKAKHLAQEGRDQEARAVCRNLLKKNASDIPVMLLLGRLYSWDQHYDSARIVLQRALDKHPENELILKAIINNEIWAGNSDKALEYANRGIGQHPQSEAFLVLKAKALLAKKDYTAALRAVDSALSINPRDTEALRMQENLKKEMRLNLVGIHYEHDAFDRNYSPWNSLSLYYARKTNLGPLVATVNYANRFSIGGYEYLLDFYPRLNRKTFLYLNAGVS
ncbi:MAG TPA: tetratricopeptide repeat protein, partial [Bacteroidia bacterium]|nr:tetratricopeptide repeat protein [Bacteroidia bacterium]